MIERKYFDNASRHSLLFSVANNGMTLKYSIRNNTNAFFYYYLNDKRRDVIYIEQRTGELEHIAGTARFQHGNIYVCCYDFVQRVCVLSFSIIDRHGSYMFRGERNHDINNLIEYAEEIGFQTTVRRIFELFSQ